MERTMKTALRMLTLALGAAFAAPLAAPVSGVVAAPKKAVCVVCNEGEEPVRATARHEGKEYYFCNAGCREQFLKDPAAYLRPAAPRPAPAFTLKNLSGETVSLADYRGKVVLLDYWATFCSPCIKAMPKLQKLHDQYGPNGFAVLGIATDEKGASVVAPVVARAKVRYPILLANEAAWTNYNVTTLPTMFLIDRTGQIVQQFGGNTDHKTVEGEVRKLVAQGGNG
jgi:peroxiredoxin